MTVNSIYSSIISSIQGSSCFPKGIEVPPSAWLASRWSISTFLTGNLEEGLYILRAQQFLLSKFTSRNWLNGNNLTSTKSRYMFGSLNIIILIWKQPEWPSVVDYSWKKYSTTMQENIYYTVIKYSELW